MHSVILKLLLLTDSKIGEIPLSSLQVELFFASIYHALCDSMLNNMFTDTGVNCNADCEHQVGWPWYILRLVCQNGIFLLILAIEPIS